MVHQMVASSNELFRCQHSSLTEFRFLQRNNGNYSLAIYWQSDNAPSILASNIRQLPAQCLSRNSVRSAYFRMNFRLITLRSQLCVQLHVKLEITSKSLLIFGRNTKRTKTRSLYLKTMDVHLTLTARSARMSYRRTCTDQVA